MATALKLKPEKLDQILIAVPASYRVRYKLFKEQAITMGIDFNAYMAAEFEDLLDRLEERLANFKKADLNGKLDAP